MKLGDWFETRHRREKGGSKGEAFVTLKDGHPEWLQTAVREAHHGVLPDDWIYGECAAICEAIDTGDLVVPDDSDDLDEDCLDDDCLDALKSFVSGRVDVYTKNVFAWAHRMCLTDLFAEAEEHAMEIGFDEEMDTVKWLGGIQWFAIHLVAKTMLQGLRGHVNPEWMSIEKSGSGSEAMN